MKNLWRNHRNLILGFLFLLIGLFIFGFMLAQMSAAQTVVNATATGGTGSVTSVALTCPATLCTVAGSPVTTSGTLAISLTPTIDFSAATQIKFPVAPGYVAAANGEMGFDSTALNWHIWGNGVDNINVVVPASVTVVDEHCVDWSVVTGVITVDDAGASCLTNGGALGTPSSGTLTNATGLPLNGVVSPTGAIATVALGNNPWTVNSAQTTNSQSAVTLGETTAATGGSGNNEVTISTLANSTSTVLNISQGAISTVFPIAAVAIAGGNNTGATNVPVLSLTDTRNNASLAGPILAITTTDTSVAAGAMIATVLGGAAGTTIEFNLTSQGAVRTNTGFFNTLAAGDSEFSGGLGTGATAATQGGGNFHGADDSIANASAHAGFASLRGGMLTNATPNAASMEGPVSVQSGFLKGSAVAALGDVVCGTTTAYTVTDCSHTGPGANIVGIATSTSNPIGVIGSGQALVKTDGAVTLGDILCMGTTTDGLAHDNGTVPCSTSSVNIGVVIAVAGSPKVPTGATYTATAMSTTLPLVELNIYPVIAAMPATSTVTGADYTNTTTTPSTVWSFTLPATAAAKSYSYKCSALWESTAATLVGPVIGLNLSAAPTQLTGSAWAQSTLTGTDTTGYLSNTTTGSQTLITSAAAGVTSTNYRLDIWGTIEGAATAGSTFIINAASTSGTTASLNIRRGGQCSLSQIVAGP